MAMTIIPHCLEGSATILRTGPKWGQQQPHGREESGTTPPQAVATPSRFLGPGPSPGSSRCLYTWGKIGVVMVVSGATRFEQQCLPYEEARTACLHTHGVDRRTPGQDCPARAAPTGIVSASCCCLASSIGLCASVVAIGVFHVRCLRKHHGVRRRLISARMLIIFIVVGVGLGPAKHRQPFPPVGARPAKP